MLALLAVALAVPACRGGRRGTPPERWVPADVRLAIVVPEAGRAARELAALHATLSGFPGAGDLATLRGALAAQLGFDPLDPDALADAGLDRRRGAALALTGRDASAPPLLVLPVKDAPKHERLLARLARERLGAESRTAEPHGATATVVFRSAPGAPAALAYAVVDRTALVAPGPSGPAAVAAAATLAPERALPAAQGFLAAQAAIGADSAALAFVPAGSPLLAGRWAVRDGLALGVTAGAGRLRARLAVLLGAREPSFQALAAKGGRGGEAALRLMPDAAAVLTFDGDPAALGRKLVPLVPAPDRARLAARGVDLQRDLFDVLAPGAALALSLSPRLALGDLDEATARADPLRVVELEAVLPLKPGATAAAERLAAALQPPAPAHASRPRRPSPSSPAAARSPRANDGRIATPSGEIAWRLEPDLGRLLLAGGAPGRLEALEARLAGGGAAFAPPTAEAREALSGPLGGGVLDVQRLVASVRALPDDAFGTGPSGFVVRSVVDRFLEPAARLAAVSGSAQLAADALVVTVDVEAREGGDER